MKHQWKEPLSYRELERYVIAFRLQIVLFALCALTASCTTTDYFGKAYPPTQHVDVFFRPEDVKRANEVMGEIRAQADEFVSLQSIQQQLVSEAKQKGADAILIEHVGTTETGFKTVENKSKEKKHGEESSSTTVSTTQIEQNRLITAKLLKYR